MLLSRLKLLAIAVRLLTLEAGVWEVRNSSEEIAGLRGERGLFASSASKHHAIVVAFEEPVVVKEKELVVQYEVTLHRRFDCGGAYIKVLPVQAAEEAAFSDRSPYLLMFGPDKCSNRKKVPLLPFLPQAA